MADRIAREQTLEWLASRLHRESRRIGYQWLERLDAFLSVERPNVFPTRQLLDHIPELIEEIALYVGQGSDEDIAANSAVMRKAAELGQLRYVQRASVDQLFREHRILAALLADFVEGEVAASPVPVDPIAAMRAQSRVLQAVTTLQQQTVDAFVTEYTSTIERQTAQLRKFSRLVSHEIRQPLGVLQVITKALSVRDGDVDSTRMMDIFDRSVSRLADVTSKLERLARITQRTDLSPSEQDVDLSALAADVARQLGQMAVARDVDLRVQDNLPVLRLDAARAELVFINLIANAIKYSDPSKARRFVEVYGVASEQPTVIVRDNGLGIPADRLQNIFREFVRAHAQRDHELGRHGLGLGLAIVRECMDAANGSVRVESREGLGTTFKLTWPTPEH